ncbi:hypothetical protein [Sinimarinibacterium flocculans]|uniref:hypothetical protein n=1 Tax=Sinimarinibacterium flocculans TaxID=985250 RepID=UPI003514B2E2
MKLEIISVHGRGEYDNEHVLLKVTDACDIGHYMLGDSTYTADGKVSNKVRHTYWFPDTEVEKGDLVSLWTKAGTSTYGTTKSGDPVHRFFWGLKTAVWNDTGDCAVLWEMNTWQFFKVR